MSCFSRNLFKFCFIVKRLISLFQYVLYKWWINDSTHFLHSFVTKFLKTALIFSHVLLRFEDSPSLYFILWCLTKVIDSDCSSNVVNITIQRLYFFSKATSCLSNSNYISLSLSNIHVLCEQVRAQLTLAPVLTGWFHQCSQTQQTKLMRALRELCLVTSTHQSV